MFPNTTKKTLYFYPILLVLIFIIIVYVFYQKRQIDDVLSLIKLLIP